ncbi:MAG: hypothetical protein IT581_19100 [Verrucomicrobiales bacterium]|nr:hypothetical protein [Verrucomicrobiales bacterium]
MPSRSGSPRSGRKNPRLFGFVFAWLEEREVCAKAIDLVLPTHRNGWLKPEVQTKLSTLNLDHPVQADLHRRVSQALALLEAVEAGTYRAPDDWHEMQPWLARALAYFVKNGDAIPDHFEDGFEDDHREFVEMGEKLGVLLDHFEAWQRKRKSR